MFPRREPRKDRQVRSLLEDDRGVSPVIGTILVLAISTVGIFAVMYWGVPAMTEVQDRTSFEAVLEQYRIVDSTVENVVRGGAPDKASTVQLSVPGGSLEWNEGTRFLVELYFDQTADPLADFVLTGWADRDETVNVRNVGEDLENASLVFTNWRGVQSDVRTIDVGLWDGDDDGDGGVDFQFAVPSPLHEHVVSLRIDDEGVKLYEAWVLDIGQLKWEFGTSLNVLEMVAENAATLTNQSGTFWLHDRPLIHSEPYADDTEYHERVTVYLAQLVRNPKLGSPNVEGAGAYRVLFALEDNFLRNANVNVDRFDIRVHGPWREAWLAYFEDAMNITRNALGDGVSYDPPDDRPVRFALFHSRIWTTILPFNTLVSEDGEVIENTYNPDPPDPPPTWGGSGASRCETHLHQPGNIPHMHCDWP